MANKKLPSIKKNIESFLNSEEGKISKKSALDLGIGIVALSLLLRTVIPETSQAITSHISHSSHSNCHSNHSSCHSSCHEHHQSGGAPPRPPDAT